jgi:protein phosphatase PTC7
MGFFLSFLREFLYFLLRFHMIPHPKKVAKGGEDAYFVSNGLLAIADGVGGWGEMGIDPGLFSKELCLKFSL